MLKIKLPHKTTRVIPLLGGGWLAEDRYNCVHHCCSSISPDGAVRTHFGEIGFMPQIGVILFSQLEVEEHWFNQDGDLISSSVEEPKRAYHPVTYEHLNYNCSFLTNRDLLEGLGFSGNLVMSVKDKSGKIVVLQVDNDFIFDGSDLQVVNPVMYSYSESGSVIMLWNSYPNYTAVTLLDNPLI